MTDHHCLPELPPHTADQCQIITALEWEATVQERPTQADVPVPPYLSGDPVIAAIPALGEHNQYVCVALAVPGGDYRVLIATWDGFWKQGPTTTITAKLDHAIQVMLGEAGR